ncbi:MAG: leucine-rich repeat protein, partial [Oscillospiraceae bacterium]|nr:leucine-rich repeat protein [Oscillospiraceae bacterium]
MLKRLTATALSIALLVSYFTPTAYALGDAALLVEDKAVVETTEENETSTEELVEEIPQTEQEQTEPEDMTAETEQPAEETEFETVPEDETVSEEQGTSAPETDLNKETAEGEETVDVEQPGENEHSIENETIVEIEKNADVAEETVTEEPANTQAASVAYGTEVISGTCEENLTWVLTDDGTLTVSGTGAMKGIGYYSDSPWYKYRGKIEQVVIENGVTNICGYAFSRCSNLKTVKIPDSVTSIETYGFYMCTSISKVYYSGSKTQWNNIDIGWENSYLTSAERYYETVSVNCINNGFGTVIADKTEIKIGETVTFTKENINHETYYDIVLTLNGEKFDGNTYTLTDYSKTGEVNLTLIGIGKYGYIVGTCGENLIYVLSNGGTLTISGTGAMTDWRSSLYTPWYSYKSQIKQVVIENGVTTVGLCAFSDYYNLKTVKIPDSVTSIGHDGFDNCTSISKVYYSGSKTQWNNIYIKSLNFCLTSAERYYGTVSVNCINNEFGTLKADKTEIKIGETVTLTKENSNFEKYCDIVFTADGEKINGNTYTLTDYSKTGEVNLTL